MCEEKETQIQERTGEGGQELLVSVLDEGWSGEEEKFEVREKRARRKITQQSVNVSKQKGLILFWDICVLSMRGESAGARRKGKNMYGCLGVSNYKEEYSVIWILSMSV